MERKRSACVFVICMEESVIWERYGIYMKLLHLADLHLGKRVYEFSMIEDQKYILEQILQIIDARQIDGVLLAGDIYDKPIPSAEAVQLFDSFLSKLADREKKVFLISGNHDSAERLSFGASLFAKSSVYFATGFGGSIEKVRLYDEYGAVNIYLLPFIKPIYVKLAYPDKAEEITSYQDALRIIMEQTDIEEAERNVIVLHQFVTGAKRCESEEISIGGLDNVEAALFEKFDYAAMGHIHSPQWILKETIRYAGTPLKYSLSECSHEKTAAIIELQEKGNLTITQIPFQPLHDMRKIKGTYAEVTAKKFYENTNTEDYVQITLTDEEDIFDALSKLRVIYPNLLRLEYDNCRTRNRQEIQKTEAVEQKSPLTLVKELFALQNNKPMSKKQEKLIIDYMKQIWEEEK